MRLGTFPCDPVGKWAEGLSVRLLYHKALSQVSFPDEVGSKETRWNLPVNACSDFCYKHADLLPVSHLPFPLQFSCWQDEVVVLSGL